MTEIATVSNSSMLSVTDLHGAPINPEEGQFTSALRTVFSQHDELRRLYAIALDEIAQLQREIADLRAGKRTKIIIDGRTFTLDEGAPSLEPLKTTSNGHNGHKSEVADSFVL